MFFVELFEGGGVDVTAGVNTVVNFLALILLN